MTGDLRDLAIKLLNVWLGIVVFFLGLRFVFRLFGASPDAIFVSWVYSISDTLLVPFTGIFTNQAVGRNSVFDLVTLVALVIYVLLIYLLIALVKVLTQTNIQTKKPPANPTPEEPTQP